MKEKIKQLKEKEQNRLEKMLVMASIGTQDEITKSSKEYLDTYEELYKETNNYKITKDYKNDKT